MTSTELRARILAEVKKTPSDTRVQHRKRIAMIVALGTVATSAVFFAMGGFATGTRPTELIAFSAGFALVAAIVLTRISTTRPGSMLPRASNVVVTAAVAAAPVLAVCALAAAAMWPEPASEDVPAKTHLACGLMTIAQGALPLIVLVVPRRGTDPVHPVITGAALGMSAGAWTAMMAYLRCPHASATHCILAHVVPTLVLTAVGAVLGRMILRTR